MRIARLMMLAIEIAIERVQEFRAHRCLHTMREGVNRMRLRSLLVLLILAFDLGQRGKMPLSSLRVTMVMMMMMMVVAGFVDRLERVTSRKIRRRTSA